MKIIIECEKCHNRVEIEPERIGNTVGFEQALMEHNFSCDYDIDVDLADDVVSDSLDVDTELDEICIRCNNCGEYILLFF